MNILVFDNQNIARAKAMAATLSRVGFESLISYNNEFLDKDERPAANASQKFDVILWHKTDEEGYTRAKHTTACSISYSAGPGAEISRLLSSDGLTNEEAAHVASVVKTEKNASSWKQLILGYWQTQGEARLALRLLSEAWQFCDGKESKPASRNADGSPGLVIHSPRADPTTLLNDVSNGQRLEMQSFDALLKVSAPEPSSEADQ
jgi:hypothetical protein